MLIRKKNRLTSYDYSNAGHYFVTLSTHSGSSLFGRLKNKTVEFSEIGAIVKKYLENISNVFENVSIDEYIIMPDHLHAIIIIDDNYIVVDAESASTKKQQGLIHAKNQQGSAPVKIQRGAKFAPPTNKYITNDRSKMLLCKVIQQFKRACTIEIRQRKLHRDTVWQRSFYDRVIRNENELYLTQKYIKDNPAKWQLRREIK